MDRAEARYYADVPNRLVALAIDAVLLTILVFAAAVVVSLILGPAVEFDTSPAGLDEAVVLDRDVAIVDAVVSLALSAAYFIGSWVRRAGTPGQRLIGVQVTAADGASLPARRAFVRWLALGAPFGVAAVLMTAAPEIDDAIPDTALAIWYLVLLVSVARSPVKQGLHDRLAGSVLAKRGRPVSWDSPPADAG